MFVFICIHKDIPQIIAQSFWNSQLIKQLKDMAREQNWNSNLKKSLPHHSLPLPKNHSIPSPRQTQTQTTTVIIIKIHVWLTEMKHMRAAKFHCGSLREIRHLIQTNSAPDNRGRGLSTSIVSHCFSHKNSLTVKSESE